MKIFLTLSMLVVATQALATAKSDFLSAEKKTSDFENSPRTRAMTAIYDKGVRLDQKRLTVEVEKVNGAGDVEYIVYVSDDVVACKAILIDRLLITRSDEAVCYIK